jgi:hypothetical protein
MANNARKSIDQSSLQLKQASLGRMLVLDLSMEKIPKFNGFSYTVGEGLRLAERSFTDIPGLAHKQKQL